MTIAEMRALLGLGDEVSDAEVVEAYAVHIGATSPTPSVTVPPISIAKVKQQLGLESDDDDSDDLIATYITSAVDLVEDMTGLVLSRRQIVEAVDAFTPSLRLRRWPIVSIDAIAYRNSAGDAELAAGAFYASTGARPARVWPAAGARWPTDAMAGPGLIAITATAGFDGPEDVPGVVVQALLVIVAEFFRTREAGALSADAERAVRGLLRRHIPKVL